MYGNSLQQTCSTCDVPELSWFGHKYNIKAMEAALCADITAHSSRMCLDTAVKLYETMFGDFHDLQDVLFDHVMHNMRGTHVVLPFKFSPDM